LRDFAPLRTDRKGERIRDRLSTKKLTALREGLVGSPDVSLVIRA